MNLFTNIQIINLMAITGQQSWELLAWTMCFFLGSGYGRRARWCAGAFSL